MPNRSWFRYLLVVVLLIASVFAVGDRVSAIQDPENKVLFGPLSIGVGEAVRVNVYAIGNPNEQPWSFVVRFYNRLGDLVQERRVDAAPGVVASIDVGISNPDEFPVERLGRRTLRAEVIGFNPQPDPPGKYAATLEVYSQLTGHTSILLGGPDTLPARGQ